MAEEFIPVPFNTYIGQEHILLFITDNECILHIC